MGLVWLCTLLSLSLHNSPDGLPILHVGGRDWETASRVGKALHKGPCLSYGPGTKIEIQISGT